MDYILLTIQFESKVRNKELKNEEKQRDEEKQKDEIEIINKLKYDQIEKKLQLFLDKITFFSVNVMNLKKN